MDPSNGEYNAQAPRDPSGYAGMGQGANGIAQGGTGAVRGQAVGPMEGMQRAAAPGGGMTETPGFAGILKLLAEALRNIGGPAGGPPGAGGAPPSAAPTPGGHP
jgi:hypothetical protein